ncbi:5'-hydroxyaverantin dehydrogenase [Cladobotryum mycophilum]|uniref:5'-hydroxyaverantin dehydrogenase n=1 Tax=Cladobotryum mycophilum TaxID=491253 RepID=A0ABR0SW19_9HYPO
MVTTVYDGSYKLEKDAGFDPSNIKGKSVLITGGGSGMGEAMARAFVNAGAFVTIGDWNEENGQRVASDLGSNNAAFVKVDVGSWDDQLQLFKTALAKSPSRSLDIVIANAGHSGRDPIYWDDSEVDGEPIEPDLRIVKSCLIGCMYTTKLGLHYLARQPDDGNHDRCLILMSSIAGYCDQPGTPMYCASKNGIRGFMGSLRRTVHKNNMRINLLAPWYVRTPAIPQDNQDRLSSKGVVWAEPTNAAAATLHIASDSKLNGRCLAIVPKDTDLRGYMDMEKDDYSSEDIAAEWQRIMIAASHRA